MTLVTCTCGFAPTGASLLGSNAGIYHRPLCPARQAYDARRANPVTIARDLAERAIPVDQRGPGWADQWDAWEAYAAAPVALDG